ncbi:hypothetical protein [Aequorivita marina]|nr:hypothetical protein [Aequorivita sp. S2608]MDS1299596.1 hypothetical protein [Aequorivita sp. S2608]
MKQKEVFYSFGIILKAPSYIIDDTKNRITSVILSAPQHKPYYLPSHET